MPSDLQLIITDEKKNGEKRTKKELRKHKKKKMRQFMLQMVNSWLHKDSKPVTREMLKDILSCVKSTLLSSGQKLKGNLLVSTFIYAHKYIQRYGYISREKVLTVILMSAIVAVKFWVDIGDVDLSKVAYIAGISTSKMLRLERIFLKTLDYKLFINPGDIPECLTTVASY